jgi:hypothetical protein
MFVLVSGAPFQEQGAFEPGGIGVFAGAFKCKFSKRVGMGWPGIHWLARAKSGLVAAL